MTYKCSIQSILTIIVLALCRLSFEVCSVNQWCRPPTNVSASEYKFVVQTSEEHMSWFDALQLCRDEGSDAELFSLESAKEREWLRTQLGSFVPGIRVVEENEDRELLWLVNAHLYLYSDGLAWATGRPIDESVNREIRGASLPIHRTIPVKNCSSINGGVEAECFAISVTRQMSGVSGRDRTNIMLVDVQCTAARAFGAICKRFRDLKPPSTSARTSKYKFVLSEWIRSPTDGTVYYRIFNLERECFLRSSWYCARLLCMKHEASLTDIDDNEEYEWIVERIAESFNMERISGGTAYFVDLHRLFYNTGTWTWSGPQKDRSFTINLREHVSQDPCEQQLCARIRYAVGLNERVGLGEMYCGGKTWQARAICKKRVIAPLPTSIAPMLTSSSSPNASWFESLEMLIDAVPQGVKWGVVLAIFALTIIFVLVFVCRRWRRQSKLSTTPSAINAYNMGHVNWYQSRRGNGNNDTNSNCYIGDRRGNAGDYERARPPPSRRSLKTQNEDTYDSLYSGY